MRESSNSRKIVRDDKSWVKHKIDSGKWSNHPSIDDLESHSLVTDAKFYDNVPIEAISPKMMKLRSRSRSNSGTTNNGSMNDITNE